MTTRERRKGTNLAEKHVFSVEAKTNSTKFIGLTKVILEKILTLLSLKEIFTLSMTNKVFGKEIFTIPKNLSCHNYNFNIYQIRKLCQRYPQVIITELSVFVSDDQPEDFAFLVEKAPNLSKLDITSQSDFCNEDDIAVLSKLSKLQTLQTCIIPRDIQFL